MLVANLQLQAGLWAKTKFLSGYARSELLAAALLTSFSHCAYSLYGFGSNVTVISNQREHKQMKSESRSMYGFFQGPCWSLEKIASSIYSKTGSMELSSFMKLKETISNSLCAEEDGICFYSVMKLSLLGSLAFLQALWKRKETLQNGMW